MPVYKMSHSYSTSFPTRTIVSKPCVFGSDKKSVFSKLNSSTCAHSSSLATATSGRVRQNAFPYLRERRRSYKRGDPIASWVPFVRTPGDTHHVGSSTVNPSDFRSAEEAYNDQQSSLDKTFTIDDKRSVSSKHIQEPVRIPDSRFNYGEFLMIHNNISLGSQKSTTRFTKNMTKSVGIQVHSSLNQSEVLDTLTSVQTSTVETHSRSGTNIQSDLQRVNKDISPHTQSNTSQAISSLKSVMIQADKHLHDSKYGRTNNTDETVAEKSNSKPQTKKCSHKSTGIIVIREELQIVEPPRPKIKRKRLTKKRPAHLITSEMSQDGVTPNPLRIYVNDKGMTVKVVSFEDSSPPRDCLTTKNSKSAMSAVTDKKTQPNHNSDVQKDIIEDNTAPQRGRQCKYNRKEIREYIREKRKQRHMMQSEEKQLQSVTQARSPPNYDRKDMKEYIEKRRKLRQMKAAEEERLKKETTEMKKAKLQQLEETAKLLVKKSTKKHIEEERPEWKGPLEEDSPNDVGEEFIPSVPEFKENIPASKGEKSHTKPGYIMKPVLLQPVVKANSQKIKHPKTKSDEEIRKRLITDYKAKTRLPYEITTGGRGDVKNVKEKVSDNVGDQKDAGNISKKLSVHGVLSDKQPSTVTNNKVTQGTQAHKMPADDINLLKQIRNLKSSKKENFRQPKSEIAGVSQMSQSRILASPKENNGQQLIQAISPHKKKINPSIETQTFDEMLSVRNNEVRDETSAVNMPSKKEVENHDNKSCNNIQNKKEEPKTPDWLKALVNQPDPFNFINVIKMKMAVYEKSKNQHFKDNLKDNVQMHQRPKDKKAAIAMPTSDDTDAPSIVSSVENGFKPYNEPLTMADLKLDLPSSINSEKSSSATNKTKEKLIPTGIIKSSLSGNIKSVVSSIMSEAPLTLPDTVQSLTLHSKFSASSGSSHTKPPSSESKLELVSEQFSEVQSLEVPKTKLVSKMQGSEENTSSSEFVPRSSSKSKENKLRHKKYNNKFIRTSTPTPIIHQDLNIPLQGNFDAEKMLTPAALHLKFQAELSKLDAFDHTLVQIMEAEKQHAKKLCKPLPQIVPKIYMPKISIPATVKKTEHRSKSKNSVEQVYGQDAQKTLLISEKVSSKSQSSVTSASEIRTDSYVYSVPCSDVSDKTRQYISTVNTARDESRVNSFINTASVYTEEASRSKSPTSHITTAIDSSVNQTHVSNAFDSTVPELQQIDLDYSSTGINLSKRLSAQPDKSPDKDTRMDHLTLKLCEDLITEEDIRAAQHETLFKMRKRTLKANFCAEIRELQIQKEQLQNSKEPAVDKIKALKKKQRAVVLKYQQEMGVLKRLREQELASSQERKKFLLNIWQQHQERLLQMALTEGSTLGIDSINFSPKKTLPMEGASITSLPDNNSSASGADVSSGVNKLDEQIRHLSEKEKKLAQKKRLIQELFAKHLKLNEEENRIKEMEKKIACGIKPKIVATVVKPEDKKGPRLQSTFSKDSLQDVSEQLVSSTQHQSTAESISTQSILSISLIRAEDKKVSKLQSATSKESILEVSEHLVTSGSIISTQSVPEETDKILDTGLKFSHSSAKSVLDRETSSSGSRAVDKYNSESFESPESSETAKSKKPTTVVRSNNTSFIQERTSSGRKPSMVVIKVPLSPRLHRKSQLRYSSGSEDSILFSQNETSEQSDVEVRIAALREQLKQRKQEAEKLQREQKRARREKLKSKELSLINQIQAYDTYINQLRKDLEQQEKYTSDTPVIRPLIKQPRAVEKIAVKKSEHTATTVTNQLKKKHVTSDDEYSSVKSVSEASSIETTIQSPRQLQEVKSIEESQDWINSEMKSEDKIDGYVSEDIEEALSQVVYDNIEDAVKAGDVGVTKNEIISETIRISENMDASNSDVTDSKKIQSQITCESKDEIIEEHTHQTEDQTSESMISTDVSSIKKSPTSEDWMDGDKFFKNYPESSEVSHVFETRFVSSRRIHDPSETQSVISEEEYRTGSQPLEEEVSVLIKDEVSVVEQLHEEDKADSKQESDHFTNVSEEERECKTPSEGADVPEELFPLPVFSTEINDPPSSEKDVETEHNLGNFISIHSRSPSQRSADTIVAEHEHTEDVFDSRAQSVDTAEECITRNEDQDISGSITMSIEVDDKELLSEKSYTNHSETATPKTETLVSDKDRSLQSVLLSDENYEKSSIVNSSNDESYESDESLAVDMIKVFVKDKSAVDVDKESTDGISGKVDDTNLNETYTVGGTSDVEQTPEKHQTAKKVDKITDDILKQLIAETLSFDSQILNKENFSSENKEELVDEDVSEPVSEKSGPSKDISEEPKVLEVLADSFLNVFLHSATNDVLKIYRRKKQAKIETTDVRKRVQEIINDSLNSPRSAASRPQDYMVTTYDVLSPEPSDSSVPSEPERDLSSGLHVTEELQDKVDINGGVGVVNGGSSGADNEGFWFDEEIGLGRTCREAEELRLQQLQIEQEIQQLEQAQEQIPSYYYVREIPNKPPPPYTPPGEASRNAKIHPQLSDSIPSQQNEIDTLIVTASQHIFSALSKGEDISHLQPPDKFFSREGSGHVYNKFLFDLVRQLICEATESDNEDDLLPWDKTGCKRKKCVIPRTQDVICENVSRQVKILFGFEPRNIKENLIIRWSRKKRDHVDELLVRELHEEESEWTDYKKDEVAVKNQLTVEICNSLVADTSAALFSAFQRKIKYSQQT